MGPTGGALAPEAMGRAAARYLENSERCFWVRWCSGVPTTIDYHQLILDTADFRAGDVDTGFIPDHEHELQKPPPNPKVSGGAAPGDPPPAIGTRAAVHASPPCRAWPIAHTFAWDGEVECGGRHAVAQGQSIVEKAAKRNAKRNKQKA